MPLLCKFHICIHSLLVLCYPLLLILPSWKSKIFFYFLFLFFSSFLLCIIDRYDKDYLRMICAVPRLTSTAASIASASVPSAALVLMLIVLSAIDAPVQDVSLLWAIDWFV